MRVSVRLTKNLVSWNYGAILYTKMRIASFLSGYNNLFLHYLFFIVKPLFYFRFSFLKDIGYFLTIHSFVAHYGSIFKSISYL